MPDPLTFKEAMQSHDSDKWIQAAQEEYDALVKRGTWVLSPLPSGRKAARCKWVFKKKIIPMEPLPDTRLDYVQKVLHNNMGLISMRHSLGVLFCLSAYYNLDIQQTDVDCAFLCADLKEDIYMSQPKGFY